MTATQEQPVVTVYITNYNYGRYLEEAIQSVQKQTFKSWELIIIDDGSTDNSHEIIKKYEKQKNIFTVYQKNKGLNASNNVAIKLANGRYIMRLDADDYLDDHALEIMVKALEDNPKLALVFPDYYLIDPEGKFLGHVRRPNFEKEVTLLDLPAHGACTLFRKSSLLAVGGYDEAFKCQDGYEIWLKIIDEFPVKNINLPLFSYRQHDKSLTKNEERILQTRASIKSKFVKNKGLKPLNVLAVIPVRGKLDPRSLPLTSLGSQLLIDWTLKAALGAKNIKHTVVTTPDLNVIETLKKQYQNQIIWVERDPKLATINQATTDTLLHTLTEYEKNHESPDAVLVLTIESPFRGSMYIDKAIHTMQIYDVDVVDGVRCDDSLYYMHTGHGLKLINEDQTLRLERNNLYKRCGGLHLIKTQALKSGQGLLSGKIGHIHLDEKAAFTIRSEFDWKIANLLCQDQEELIRATKTAANL